jgi:uncharacterized protein YeaO (DUF488 family)
MIKCKHLMDVIEPDDGPRVWVEPLGLTRDLRAWCRVSNVLPGLGPPRDLWDWFESHPLAYEMFRGCYHQHLDDSGLRPDLWRLAKVALTNNVTLLHQADDPAHNTATALHDYLSELSAYCTPDV